MVLLKNDESTMLYSSFSLRFRAGILIAKTNIPAQNNGES